ncbi:TIGR03085 family metal-binding protein [Phytohabitans sp. ZYX-F-186]|uniref:TIGR03085 family metal-binding protein n=1 Tax=Phytohabitans maris TaxID=3071409 RepID=A0ABU0ZDY2_9ACTN|nr:TIGR03085 family metal-binding protein [Phytohabitans sp. ZYX-F-186]MDQ7904562.1 TIGR03085 family metal-binding protein [Phytohabitans sp. ZYX-F-186]
MARYAQSERQLLADLLLAVGPDAPTLCEGWTSRDLAAHLVMRERRLDAAAGIVVGPLRGHSERVRTSLAARPYPELVGMVRAAPWWSPVSNRLADAAVNTMEFFIHHEDVRRGRPGWRPRELSREQQEALWRRAKGTARLALRRVRAAVRVQAPGYGETTVGTGGDPARLVGAPGELVIFLSGRQRAARVQVDAAPELAAFLRTAKLGV